MAISEKDRQVYEYIKARIDEGYAPTVREICAELGFKSTSTAFRCINSLTENGYLEKSEGRNRAIKLARASGAVTVPLVGTVTAGVPITAFEEVTDYISFKSDKHFQNPLFALKVRGDSMINAAILDGDIVVAEQRQYAENGEIVVALVDGENATVKRFYKERGHFRLQPENDTMAPIICDEVSILGKVVGLIRHFD